MSFNRDLNGSKGSNIQSLIARVEETHYPEDGYVTSEIIKILSKQSRNFGTFYREFMDQLKRDFDTGIINAEYYEQQLSEAIKDINGNASELERVENLMKGFKFLGKGDIEIAATFLSSVPSEETINEVAIPFSRYADSFIRSYLKHAYELMKATNKIPNYVQVLRKAFCSSAKGQIINKIKKINLDEDSFKEGFDNINAILEQVGINIPATDNIKEEFIKICREKYPLAKNSYNAIFENKKFKNDFIEKMTKLLDDFLNEYFSRIIERIQHFLALGTKEEEHGYIVNNVILNYNAIIKRDYWEDHITGKYFLEILETFKKDHNKKIKAQQMKEEAKNIIPLETEEVPIINGKEKLGWRYILDEETNSLIKEAVGYIDCNDKVKVSIEKFITKLVIKDFPLRFSDIRKIFKLDGIPIETEIILTEKLGIEYEKEKEIENHETNKEGTEEEKKEEINITEGENNVQEIIIEDPIQYFIERIESLGYTIPNKNILKKQITEFCKNSTYKTVLINLLKNERFGETLFHRCGHKKARVLPIGKTGWRLLLIKQGKKIIVDSFCNHDNYRDRLVDIKN